MISAIISIMLFENIALDLQDSRKDPSVAHLNSFKAAVESETKK